VHSLGVGGSLTLGFDVVIVGGPGADFVVAENAFYQAGLDWHTFAEVAFVEVSTDGATFARMPARYFGPAIDPGPFGAVVVGGYENLAGSTPVLAGPGAPGADPRDLVAGGGDAFDLADLAHHPEVVAGRVDLRAIHEIRLVDVRSGVDVDDRGVIIFDAGAGSADIDAVTIIHHAGSQSAGTPEVELSIPADGRFRITIRDPNGLVDLASIRTSLFGLPVPPADLLGGLTIVQVNATSATFELGVPVPPGVRFQCGVSVFDHAGNISGARRARPDGR
jgi:hypothetical protein